MTSPFFNFQGRGLCLHPEGRDPPADEPPCADLPPPLPEEGAVPPGAAGLLLEVLRAQQEVPLLRAQVQRRAGHPHAHPAPSQRCEVYYNESMIYEV